mmetsp:Transcript_25384/g.84855  ORF Transcript_25384/g.84855 Transcript_25384/m.84855 type:complete len:325 (+) Transcript_25384:184-1158(+)
MANYLIVLATAVRSAAQPVRSALHASGPLCQPVATLIGTLVLLPGNQLRTLSGLVGLSAVSFATICATVVICLWTLVSGMGACDDEPSASMGFLDYNASMCGFIFAFSGQSIMLEMQAEMRQPRDFPKAVQLSFSTLFTVYTLVVVLSYHTCGRGTPGELLQVVPPGGWSIAVGVLMIIHMTVTYTILQQVLTRACCLFLVPGALGQGPSARAKWFVVSTVLMALAYVVANSVPLFTDIVNLTGGLLSTQCAFTLPALLYLSLRFRLPNLAGNPLGPRAQRACVAGAYVSLFLGAYFTVFGAGSSLLVLIKHAQEGLNPPFGCN